MSIGTFKLSSRWDNNCGISFDNLIADAAFAFQIDKSHIRIVTKNNYNGINCFQIGYDKKGLIAYGGSKFNDSWGHQVMDGTQNVKQDSIQNIIHFIKQYLIEDGAQELVFS